MHRSLAFAQARRIVQGEMIEMMNPARNIDDSTIGSLASLQRYFTVVFIISCILFLCVHDEAQTASRTKLAFDKIVLGYEGKMYDMMLWWDLNEDGLLDIILAHVVKGVTDDDRRFVSVWYQRRNQGFPGTADQTIALPSDAVFLVLGNHTESPGREVGFLARDGLWMYERENGLYLTEPRRVLEHKSLFKSAQEDNILFWSVPRNIDGKGLEDLIFPAADGYLVVFADGKEGLRTSPPLSIPVSGSVRRGLTKEFFTYSRWMPPIAIGDFNADGRSDLVSGFDGRFHFFLQQPDGNIPTEPSIKYGFSLLEEKPQKNLIRYSHIMFEDLDKDGYHDLICFYITGTIGVFESTRTQILVYRGRPGAFYRGSPDSIINLIGFSVMPHFTDVNGDGKLDLILSSVRTDLMAGVKTTLLRNIKVTYYVFLWETRSLGRTPAYDVTIDIPIEEIEQANVPHVRFDGDFDGDGRKDQLTIAGEGNLEIRKGVKTSGILVASEVGYEKGAMFHEKIDLPNMIDIHDINFDGKDDFTLRYRSRVVVYLSR